VDELCPAPDLPRPVCERKKSISAVNAVPQGCRKGAKFARYEFTTKPGKRPNAGGRRPLWSGFDFDAGVPRDEPGVGANRHREEAIAVGKSCKHLAAGEPLLIGSR
jgi:hypothetical protein